MAKNGNVFGKKTKGEVASLEVARITLPWSNDFLFSPMDEKGKLIPISSIIVRDTQVVINTHGSFSQGTFRLVNPGEEFSFHDSDGKPVTYGEDESGDRFGESAVRFVDWFSQQKDTAMNDQAKRDVQAIQKGRREIIIQKEGR